MCSVFGWPPSRRFPSRTPHTLFKWMQLYGILCRLPWRCPELRLRIGCGQCTRWATRSANMGWGIRGPRASRVQGSAREPQASGMLWRCVLTSVMYGMRTGRVRHARGGTHAGMWQARNNRGARAVVAMGGYRHREKSC